MWMYSKFGWTYSVPVTEVLLVTEFNGRYACHGEMKIHTDRLTSRARDVGKRYQKIFRKKKIARSYDFFLAIINTSVMTTWLKYY